MLIPTISLPPHLLQTGSNQIELLAGYSGYRQSFYTLLKMNKNLERLQVLNVCGMQATDHSVAKGFGAECCCNLIYM